MKTKNDIVTQLRRIFKDDNLEFYDLFYMYAEKVKQNVPDYTSGILDSLESLFAFDIEDVDSDYIPRLWGMIQTTHFSGES